MTTEAYNKEIDKIGAYTYTQTLSGKMSMATIDEAMHDCIDVRGKTILDIGCGDGTYTTQYALKGAASVHGIDPVEAAVIRASREYADIANLTFQCQDIYAMPVPQVKYDMVVLRGVLHHMDNLEKAIAIVCRMGREIVLMEPNGYNPLLKIIEKVSPYHIAHKERSFPPVKLRALFRRYGGTVDHTAYVGLVPVLCPDAMARFLKVIEPAVEAIPFIRQIACGQYIMHIVVGGSS